MTYTLSTGVVADNVQSLAALHELSTGSHEPVLDPDRSGILRHMIRNAFASLCLEFGGMVTDFSVDGETADGKGFLPVDPADRSDVEMTVEFSEPRGFTPGKAGVVRRSMELAVSMLVLAGILRAQGRSREASETEVAASVHIGSVRNALLEPPSPIRRFI